MTRAEQLLAVRYHEYRDEDGPIHIAPDSASYSVPTGLATSLAFIHASSAAEGTARRRPSRDTVQPRQARANGTSLRWDCLKYMTPECLGRLYNMPALSANDTPPETAFRLQQTLSSRNYTFTSGGGFSNVFATPLYQQPAVQSYLDSPDYYDYLANLSSV